MDKAERSTLVTPIVYCTAAVCVAVTVAAAASAAWRRNTSIDKSSKRPKPRRRTAADTFFSGDERAKQRPDIADVILLSSEISEHLRSHESSPQCQTLVVELLRELSTLTMSLCRWQQQRSSALQAQRHLISSVHTCLISLEAMLRCATLSESDLQCALQQLKDLKSMLEYSWSNMTCVERPPTPPISDVESLFSEAEHEHDADRHLAVPGLTRDAHSGITPCADSLCWIEPPPEYSPPAASSSLGSKSVDSKGKQPEETVDKSPDREDRPDDGDALYEAVNENNITALDHLLSSSMDPCSTFGDLRRTPLHQAAHLNHVGCLTVLLRHGAVMNTEDAKGDTALHLGAWAGHAETVSVLLAFGAEVDWLSGRDGYSPLWCAISAYQLEITRILLRHGAQADQRSPSPGGLMPLHQAAVTEQAAMIELLLEHGAEIDCREDDQNTPLHYAAASGSVATVGILLRDGADIEAQQAHGLTAVHWAAHKGHAEVLGLLLDHGAKIDPRAQEGATPLHLAANRGHMAATRLLLARGARRDCGVAKWSSAVGTPAELAKAKGFAELAKVLKC